MIRMNVASTVRVLRVRTTVNRRTAPANIAAKKYAAASHNFWALTLKHRQSLSLSL